MKKKIILVLFLAIQVSCIVGAPVQDEQVTLLAKQKREFVRGVRGIRHVFSKDTITLEERAALKSLVKKGAVLTAALVGIAVAGYVGKKYLGKVSGITLPEVVGGEKLIRYEKNGGSCLVTIKRLKENPLREQLPSDFVYFKVTIEVKVANDLEIAKQIKQEIDVAIKKIYPRGVIWNKLLGKSIGSSPSESESVSKWSQAV